MNMVLKPQDVMVVLKLAASGSRKWTYVKLAYELFMSASEINAGVKRALRAGLLNPPSEKGGPFLPNHHAVKEFLVHGIKYAFPPDRGELTRGLPTAAAAPPLRDMLLDSHEPPPVWPDPEGPNRGYSFSPLYRTAPKAATADTKLYELLALVDAIRGGTTRERNLAVGELKARLRK
jgi:hypothetical protein